MEMVIIFQLAILIFSVVIHELSHGFVADRLGDRTARDAGRLTLNPLSHLDPIGSFLVPLLTYFMGGFILGWAKPVPYNPFNLRDPKKHGALIASAGPASNFLIAVVFGFLFRLAAFFGPEFAAIGIMFVYVVQINILLGIFNLVPIPPLDGSKVLFGFLPDRMAALQWKLEQYGFFIVLFFLFAGGFRLIWPIIAGLSKLILGM